MASAANKITTNDIVADTLVAYVVRYIRGNRSCIDINVKSVAVNSHTCVSDEVST